MANFKEELQRVETFVFDVDGVFTNGGITLLPGGDFLRTYYAKDGYAFTYAASQGYKMFIISGGRGELLERRFNLLHATAIISNSADKVSAMRELVAEYGIDLSRTVYMGDDIPDVEVMKMVGIPVCPADAAIEVVDAAIYVSQYGGGRGCVRDIIEQVLRAQGKWALHMQGVNTI
jgi:3-deoxy-D-manno-octulosonate 8-phosphate phosphatase (KDO 8-P phosphatase)